MTATTPQDSRTEATRLLCAGTYLDIEFRRQVVEELVEHEERPIAPSLGVDVVPVLAHALRARRQDALTALMLLVLWAAFIGIEVGTADEVPLPKWSGIYALVSFAQWSAAASAGRGSSVYVVDKRTLREAMKGNVRKLVPAVPAVLAIGYWLYALYSLATGGNNWIGIVFPLLLVLPVWAHRRRVADVMGNELSREAFLLAPRAEPTTAYHQRIARAIDREQYAGMAIYDAGRPFIGMGKPYEPWSFALELRRRGDADASDDGAPFTGRTVVDLVRPRLEALRQGAAATSRDRLKDLEIEEFVYLPVGPPRPRLDYADTTVTRHVAEAVDEGGEARRYFLRVRVGAWDEQVVVSVLVRVHTQGGMLVLEVVPHILTPIRTEFRSVDVIAARGQDDPLRDGLRALLSGPAAGFAAAVSTVRAGVSGFRTWLAEPQRALPDGPAKSVRELGGAETVSLFQEMDISRYVKTVQDRIASGVRDALRSQGYETDQFEQQIVQISEGGVFIGSMSGGAVAAGAGAKAKNMTKDGGS
ncbi:hypothetical protein [Streptomyces albireticuli]|uniref:Uncharacterized protein n=1 Tax=Streptomyces albireticuli TaxID=1940 RepID=A0A2A2DAF6_9ACTN|nr:hypothetical protein [Streptomyces albireticuli]MCD9142835.1 hypothetical protein [Streptomyces albireticuli]MCD9162846.1 hypothetical protein [Streptomyces albireticuli]MCD9192406.1 hypothetical protein [Streptomyces albireticuli]PAU48350.1 hypothetical protein CK936_13810 [Streptomyces albireticuli]